MKKGKKRENEEKKKEKKKTLKKPQTYSHQGSPGIPT